MLKIINIKPVLHFRLCLVCVWYFIILFWIQNMFELKLKTRSVAFRTDL